MSDKTHMHGDGESDSGVVPTKQPNKSVQPLAEVVEGLLCRLEADERTIIEMSLQGFTTKEISEQTGRAERSVRRLRERVRKYLERQQSEIGQ